MAVMHKNAGNISKDIPNVSVVFVIDGISKPTQTANFHKFYTNALDEPLKHIFYTLCVLIFRPVKNHSRTNELSSNISQWKFS